MSDVQRFIKPVVALVILGVILLTVMNWWGDYRTPDPVDVGETTATVEATATPEGEAAPEESEPEAEESLGTVIVLVNGLNFRKEASSDSEQIRGLATDTRLDLLGEDGDWYKVRDSDGVVGYVSSSSQYTRVER